MSETKQSLAEFLFEAASQKLDPAERNAFLDGVCRDDPALRARLDLLLEGHFQGEGFLTKNREREAKPIEPPPPEPPSAMVGRYKLLEKIGEGGFGEVWMAEQKEPVKRRVALKILKLGMDTRQVVGRFEAERQALALMDHPNIARVLDAGATDTGRPYFVMDLVRGIKITDYCDQNNLPTQDRLDLFIKVCQAIQHAHQKGIIHRDIKPSNILVTLHDGVPVPKVIDFGIAKATQQELTDKTLFTQFQQFLGTPAYMSPEQAEMSGLDMDTRSDIYSLGVLLYELLVGRTPFDAKELMQGGLEALRRMIREREPMRPSTNLNTLNGEDLTTTARRRQTDAPKLLHLLRGDLDWIVMKCLEKDRTRRYETANGLVMDLKRYLSGEPVTARPPSTMYRVEKFVRRHRVGVAFSLSAVVILVAGLVLTLLGFAEARQERDAKAAEAARAKAVSELLQEMLGSANPDAVKGSDYTVRELLDSFSEELGDQLKDQPEVEMSIQATIGKAYLALHESKRATIALDTALKLAKECLRPDDPRYIEILVDRADWSQPSAEDYARQAVSICREHPGKPERMIHALRGLELCLWGKGNYTASERVGLEALAYAAEFPDREFADTGLILHDLASMQLYRNPAQAEATARQAVDLHRRLHGPYHPVTGRGLLSLGLALKLQNRLPEAEAVLRETHAIFRRNFRPNHTAVRWSVIELVAVLQQQGKVEEVEALYRENLALQQKIRGVDHPDVELTRKELCLLLLNQGRFEEAEGLLRESAGLLKSANPEAFTPDALTSYTALIELVNQDAPQQYNRERSWSLFYARGTLLYRARRYPEALQQLTQAYQLGQRGGVGPKWVSPASGAYLLAMTHARLGHTNQAGDWFRRAFVIDRTTEPVAGNTTIGGFWDHQATNNLVREEAETVLREMLGSSPGHLELLAFQKAWAPVADLLRKGRDACANRRWIEATAAFEAALKEPAFDWRLVGAALMTAEQWIGVAYFRAGDDDRHSRFFRELDLTEGKPVEPLGGFLRAMLLPTDPAPELLTLASNLLPASGVVFPRGFESSFYNLHRCLLEYRTDRFAEAAVSSRKSGETLALIIESMACHHLGQTNEARVLWQQANARLVRLRSPENANHMSVTAECYLEEAARLLGLENELPDPPAAEAQPTNAVAPR